MENGEATFYGMSSVSEYWNRASETDRSEIKTSSSDDSADESKSSNKEYRDASCYVDFEEELEEIVNEDASNIVEDSREIIKLPESKIEEKAQRVKPKSSRYVRWDVLMSLGLGLWVVLCVVDVLHSVDNVTKDTFFEFTREKTNVSKTVLVKSPETHVWWLFHVWPYLWRFIWISGAGAAYILLILLLLIVFCADPRIRKTVDKAAVKINVNGRIATAREIKHSIVENKTCSERRKSQNSRAVRPVIQKVVPVKLVLSPAIHLHAKILSSFEQRTFDLKTTQTRKIVVKRRIATVPTILQPICRHPSQCGKPLIVNRCFFGQLHGTSCRILKLPNAKRKCEYSIVKASPSGHPMGSSTSTCSFRKIDLKFEEYLRKARKCPNTFHSFRTQSIEPTRNSTESSTNGDTGTRIITSSPAFKNFLLRLKHNSCVS